MQVFKVIKSEAEGIVVEKCDRNPSGSAQIHYCQRPIKPFNPVEGKLYYANIEETGDVLKIFDILRPVPKKQYRLYT